MEDEDDEVDNGEKSMEMVGIRERDKIADEANIRKNSLHIGRKQNFWIFFVHF